MKSPQQQSITPPPQTESDTLCKRLAELFPQQFVEWAFGVRGPVKVEKTELDREPIRADAAIFSHAAVETLHAEFQTTMKSNVPVPLRMLDYYIGFKRKTPQRRVRQVLIVLKPTGEAIPDHYEDERTRHGYDVIKLWEVEPRELLRHDGLLPLATLCRAESGEQLLTEVSARANLIKSRERRREVIGWSRVLAGLRYDPSLIYQILKESDMLEESTVYQDIFQKGAQRGLLEGEQQGLQQGLQHERQLVMRLLERTLGKLSVKGRKQIERLTFDQLAALGEALFDFVSEKELTAWLKQQKANR